jgi:glucose/arabinose dehydrogenase
MKSITLFLSILALLGSTDIYAALQAKMVDYKHGMLYVPVGAPCNICESKDERYATIMRVQPDGSGLKIFPHGVRNTVGFDWHPVTKELWLI